MANPTPITARGLEKLKAELHELKTIVRPRIIEAIAEARSHGDLKENAEYHAAREQQGFTEGRIAEIEGYLANCQVIDVSQVRVGSKVVFGATVDLEEVESGEQVTYQIVGDLEADIRQGLISISSPIARALIGKETGDTVTVQAPGGAKAYDILDVRYL